MQPISLSTQQDWVKGLVRIREEYSRHCNCPANFLFKPSGKISTLLEQLPEPKETISQSYKAVALLPHDIFTRQKILNLMDIKTFDVTQENLALLESYTYEDIQLIENLVMRKQYDNLGQLYDGAGTCINYTLNKYYFRLQCPGDETCSNQGTCDGATGTCICSPRFQGNVCQELKCPDDGTCSNQGTCDGATGTCICNYGFQGDRCQVNPGRQAEDCTNLGSNYRFISDTCNFYEKSRKNFCDAKQNCRDKFGSNTNGKLIEPKTMERLGKIQRLAKNIFGSYSRVWTGFEKYDDAGTDVRHNSDGSRALIQKPLPSIYGDITDSGERHLYFHIVPKRISWFDESADDENLSICESY